MCKQLGEIDNDKFRCLKSTVLTCRVYEKRKKEHTISRKIGRILCIHTPSPHNNKKKSKLIKKANPAIEINSVFKLFSLKKLGCFFRLFLFGCAMYEFALRWINI